jgi:hypothetical protein
MNRIDQARNPTRRSTPYWSRCAQPGLPVHGRMFRRAEDAKGTSTVVATGAHLPFCRLSSIDLSKQLIRPYSRANCDLSRTADEVSQSMLKGGRAVARKNHRPHGPIWANAPQRFWHLWHVRQRLFYNLRGINMHHCFDPIQPPQHYSATRCPSDLAIAIHWWVDERVGDNAQLSSRAFKERQEV